ASSGVAAALRAVDCLANQATASAVGRLFGSEGALIPALTILLTLYIAFFAVSLLTGRSSIGISALTPRMMTLGLVLTFATSWVAYQGVVWNLAIGAPDQIASVLMGAKGSATQIFADRIDLIFAAVAEVADAAGGGQGGSLQNSAAGSFTPGNLMWLGALLLLLGTVGVLVTARIALAVLLALGPVFVVMALFSGTRGLAAGWLRGVVLTAITPLFVVIGGGLMLELLVPVVSTLRSGEGINGRAALSLFMIAAVHVALMAMVLRVAGSMVAGWQVFGLAGKGEAGRDGAVAQAAAAAAVAPPAAAPDAAPAAFARRGSGLVPVAIMAGGESSSPSTSPAEGTTRSSSRTVITQTGGENAALPPRQPPRTRGVGSRFGNAAGSRREMIR
ncbi:MAG: type IV secretion system protein, partial [Novosphingobium sp.]